MGVLVKDGVHYREVKGKPGYYVSAEGHVIATYSVAVGDNGAGYKHVTFGPKAFRERVYLHRLVAETFIPNPLGLTQVDHKDSNRGNNSVSNLQWITPLDNVRKAWAKDKCLVSPDGVKHVFKNVRAFAEEHGLASSAISKLLKGKMTNHKKWTLGGM